MKLIGMLTSPYTRRVAISLTEMGLEFEHVPISVFSHLAEFKALNPVVRAPTLFLDDQTMLTDSHVIIEYFDRADRSRSLWPESDADLRAAASVLGMAQTTCDKTVQLVYERELRPAEKQFADWIDRVTGQVNAACEQLDSLVEDAPLWLEADRLNMAGITLSVVCTFMQNRIPDIWERGSFDKLNAFRESAEALPTFRRWPHASLAAPLAHAPLWP